MWSHEQQAKHTVGVVRDCSVTTSTYVCSLIIIMYVSIKPIAMNDRKNILIEIKYVLHLIPLGMAAILHSVVSLCQLSYSGFDKLQ